MSDALRAEEVSRVALTEKDDKKVILLPTGGKSLPSMIQLLRL